MLDKDKLRKADIFSGGVIALFGLWIVSQGMKMPMKDSWGGVQNVWFVSPALFPLFVGAMITLLGVLLSRMAFRSVGAAEFRNVLGWLASRELIRFLKSAATMRFYAIVLLFLSFVYLQIPRIDFFLCSVLFLLAFISMFYFDDDQLLKKFFFFYLGGVAVFLLFFIFGFQTKLDPMVSYSADWLTLVFLIIYGIYVRVVIHGTPEWKKKYRIGLIISVATPFIICPIFKYFLLVPMPTEGLVVSLLDTIWYSLF